MKLRLQKALSLQGIASRRKAEDLIKSGRVYIEEKKASLGDKVSEKENIYIDGKKIILKFSFSEELLIYNKPVGELCENNHKSKTIFDKLPKPKSGKWISIGRLDINTSGLILITNNGDLANEIIHPSKNIEREYVARIRGKPKQEDIKKLLKGIKIDGINVKFLDIVKGKETTSHTWFAMVITSGKNRSVRKLWGTIGHEVSRLKRVRIGNLFLPSNLREGSFKRVKPSDIGLIK
ncbi:MAG: pseudouridylate synthase [Chloroflexi bacterium]|nr:pseudouridylate synthase [Chloroflexota bacterium]|tara:strand:+ start:8651 stop:9358 length:708 start_codon:yes stop_codon:yes gene_type:complete